MNLFFKKASKSLISKASNTGSRRGIPTRGASHATASRFAPLAVFEQLEDRQMYSATPLLAASAALKAATAQSVVTTATSAINAEYANTAHETDAYGRSVQSLIGSSTSGVTSVPGISGAYMQTYGDSGAIYWSQQTGAHVVFGGIGSEYNNTLNGETDAYGNNAKQVLGLPTSDETNVSGIAGARMNTFQNGTILWSANTGAHAVYGGIGAEYAALNNETDAYGHNAQLVLGLPTSDETNVSGVAGARMNTFQNGVIVWSSSTGAHAVYGGIGELYQNDGGASGYIGLPTSDESGGSGYRSQFFQNGFTYWTPTAGATFSQSSVSVNAQNQYGEVTVTAYGSHNDIFAWQTGSNVTIWANGSTYTEADPNGSLYIFTEGGGHDTIDVESSVTVPTTVSTYGSDGVPSTIYSYGSNVEIGVSPADTVYGTGDVTVYSWW